MSRKVGGQFPAAWKIFAKLEDLPGRAATKVRACAKERTPEAVTTIAQAIASGLTDEEAGLLAGINRTNLSALEHAGPCATNASLFPSGHVKKTRHYDQHRVIFPSDRR